MLFCNYKNIFGEAGKGVHRFRLLDVALVDYVLTILGSILISYLTGYPLVITTIVLFCLGILFHWLFCVDTSAITFLQ